MAKKKKLKDDELVIVGIRNDDKLKFGEMPKWYALILGSNMVKLSPKTRMHFSFWAAQHFNSVQQIPLSVAREALDSGLLHLLPKEKKGKKKNAKSKH